MKNNMLDDNKCKTHNNKRNIFISQEIVDQGKQL